MINFLMKHLQQFRNWWMHLAKVYLNKDAVRREAGCAWCKVKAFYEVRRARSILLCKISLCGWRRIVKKIRTVVGELAHPPLFLLT